MPRLQYSKGAQDRFLIQQLERMSPMCDMLSPRSQNLRKQCSGPNAVSINKTCYETSKSNSALSGTQYMLCLCSMICCVERVVPGIQADLPLRSNTCLE